MLGFVSLFQVKPPSPGRRAAQRGPGGSSVGRLPAQRAQPAGVLTSEKRTFLQEPLTSHWQSFRGSSSGCAEGCARSATRATGALVGHSGRYFGGVPRGRRQAGEAPSLQACFFFFFKQCFLLKFRQLSPLFFEIRWLHLGARSLRSLSRWSLAATRCRPSGSWPSAPCRAAGRAGHPHAIPVGSVGPR